jgi:oligopeptide/dipeptide ABC transporter ATP-binding protein
MDNLLRVERLKKYFPIRGGLFKRERGYVHAVDDISFDIRKGETFGLAGESGSGKTTTGRLVLRLMEPTSGKITFEGKNIFDFSGEEMRLFRREMQIVFQNPFASLNPRRSVKKIVSDPFVINGLHKSLDVDDKVSSLLESVDLNPPSSFLDKFPHELSGGQRQRVGIARAIALNPKLIVCDEPVSALDMSIRGQVLNLLNDLQKEFNITYLLIAHDLSVLRSMCNSLAIMYLGEIVEIGDSDAIIESPMHPYSEALISATPIPSPTLARSREKSNLKGEIPSPIDPPSGCRFRTRCPLKDETCSEEKPKLTKIGNRMVACHHFQ